MTMRLDVPEDDTGGRGEQDRNRQTGASRLEGSITQVMGTVRPTDLTQRLSSPVSQTVGKRRQSDEFS